MSKNGIIVQNLVKKFDDVTAVDDLSFEVKEGELFGLLGPNGAGKTTTIKILVGLLKKTSGSAKIGNYDIEKDEKTIKKMIGVCPQEPAYYKFLTGQENIELFANLHGMSKSDIKSRTQMLLDQVGLSESADRKAGKYSGGMIRRVSLAMALINDPEIAFLDEPTVAMDPQSRHAVWDFIKQLKELKKTTILTTHYIEEAEMLCDRVGIIDHGKLIALDTPKALMDKYTAKNLEEVFITLTGKKIREES